MAEVVLEVVCDEYEEFPSVEDKDEGERNEEVDEWWERR